MAGVVASRAIAFEESPRPAALVSIIDVVAPGVDLMAAFGRPNAV
ncbi:MAG: hypothetical protein ACLP50_14240 [Solirubrobacteraceae bacterium]